MAALRVREVSGRLKTCFYKQQKAAFISTLPTERTQKRYLVYKSNLYKVRGSGGSLVQALLGCQNNGQLLLVSAVAVRHNSSQTAVHVINSTTDVSESNLLAASENVSETRPLNDAVSTPESSSVFVAESTPESTTVHAGDSVFVAESTPESTTVHAGESAPVSGGEPVLLSDPTPEVTQPITDQLNDTPVMAMDILQEAAAELSLTDMGLGGYTPVGVIQNILEFMHVSIGLPWWGAIVAGTVIARCAVFPLIVKGQREAAKLNNVMPEMTKLTNRMNEAKQSGNKFEFSKAYTDMMMFQKKHDVNPLRGFLVPLVQAPVFISFFIALRKMSYAPVPSMQSGGLWWFMDLTASDPFYILPLAVTGTMFAILELGAESGVDNPNLRAMKTVFRIMPFVILPMTINFPTAVFTYWMTSNLFSLGQVALLRHPTVREKLCIPLRITHAPAALPPSEGFIDSVKKGWKNAQLAHQLQEREKRIKEHLDIAAKGPLRQTFSHNPMQQPSAPMSTAKSSQSKQEQQQSNGKKRPWENTIG